MLENNSAERLMSWLSVPGIFRDFVAEFEGVIKPTRSIRILIVVDPEIDVTPSPFGFGIGLVIELMSELNTGDFIFHVDLAQRPVKSVDRPTHGTSGDTFKFKGFRFDMPAANSLNPAINSYHEIWFFGFKPGNTDGDDDEINHPDNIPMTDSELKALTLWMNNTGGGLFATGDHDFLGASLCSRIPRVGTMRKWTNEQGVPPQFFEHRLDTNRPGNAAQAASGGPPPLPEVMDMTVETDEVPQQIEWVPMPPIATPFRFAPVGQPHPVLFHVNHGPIDVMPDHPHEGMCFDTKFNAAAQRSEIKLDGTYNFNGFTGFEYPTVNGVRPTPRVIAYGTTLPDPPYKHWKGDAIGRRFPMISVYDGHPIGHGRVAVDSTWHHWFDMNIWKIKLAANQTNWQKISQYYINLASWLVPPFAVKRSLMRIIFRSQFEYFGLEELSPRMTVFEAGRMFRGIYGKEIGSSWITELTINWIREADDEMYQRILKEYFEPEPMRPGEFLLYPPFELIEDAILGGMIMQAYEVTNPIRRRPGNAKSKKEKITPETFEKQLLAGVNRGINDFTVALDASLKTVRKTFLSK